MASKKKLVPIRIREEDLQSLKNKTKIEKISFQKAMEALIVMYLESNDYVMYKIKKFIEVTYSRKKRNERHQNSKFVKKQPFENYYKQYKKGAEQRRLIFELTLEEFKNLVLSACFYCGQPPEKNRIRYSGIDRIKNNVGYVLKNCVGCCGKCNHMKFTMEVSEFKEQIVKLYNNLDKITQEAVFETIAVTDDSINKPK